MATGLSYAEVAANIKFASIDTASSGATEIVAAVANRKLRVMAWHAMAATAVTVQWQSAANDLSGAMSFAATGGAAPNSYYGLFETNLGEALNINLGGAVQVSGTVAYIEVD
jgi:hypothetical protein